MKDVKSGSSCSLNYERPTADDPSKFHSSSALSNCASGGDHRFNASSEREHDMQSIPGLGDFQYPVPDKPAAPTESTKSAANILQNFGLEKEDLDILATYPEDHLTPANLPFILQQIHIGKTKRAASAAQSKPCPEPQPTRSVSGMDSHSLSSSGGAGMRQEEMSSSVLQPSKEPDAARPSTSKTQPSSTLYPAVHPSPPGLVLIGSNDSSGMKDQSKTRAQESTVSEQMKKQQQQLVPVQQTQKQLVSQMGQTIWPPVFSAAKSVSPASQILSITDAVPHPVFCPIVISPAVLQPILGQMTHIDLTLPPSSRQPPAKISKSLPMAAMIHDYTAATPRIFPHTCSLCNKECTQMKDWISHQNTSLHLENCRLLRIRAVGKDAKPSPSTSLQTSRHRHQKVRHGSHSRSQSRSRSRSPSPRRHHGSEGRREKRSRRSHSPNSSRYTRRSRSWSRSRSRSHSPWYDRPTSSRYRSHSRSPESRLALRRSHESRSPPRRSHESQSPPRRSHESRSPQRRSHESRSPPRRSHESRSPPRRSHESRSPPRRSNERQSPPKKRDQRRSPLRRSDDNRSPPKRRDQRRSPQQKKLDSADILAKKLLATAAAQSLSKQSDLEDVVKTLAPALLTELIKMKSALSSSSFSMGEKASSSSTASKTKKITKKPSKAKPSLQKREASSSTKTKMKQNILLPETADDIKSVKSSPLTMVKLQGIPSSVPQNDVIAAMEHFGECLVENGARKIFIKNISQSETETLRETLEKIKSVKNFLLFLNRDEQTQVFIEFESIHDADRLGVWYSLLKRAPGHEVHRLKLPFTGSPSLSPRLPENALPNSKDAVVGAIIPPQRYGIPQASDGPFWVTMRARPFLFPTASPWFIIPDHLTVKKLVDIEKASRRGSKIHTIMLTGLPEGNYKQEDVAQLVWQYFPKKNLHSLYYRVTVLTLQRRAFVFFPDWTTCCDFVRDHIKKSVSVGGCTLSVHFVLEDMNPASSEEMMYTTLMKWSNAGVPDPESLEERLLCVEISETSVDVIRTVMEMVSSVATVVGFLPLANRICIEMADSSSVTAVVEKYSTFSLDSNEGIAWSKVERFESLKSLNQRLQDSSEITINFEGNFTVEANPPAGWTMDHNLLCKPVALVDPPLPITAGPSATETTSNAAVKEGCSTRSSSAAHITEKITSAATVKASMETHSEPLREKAKVTESAVATSDHKVSAEGIAAKTVESETKIETSEMHPPLQGHGLSQAQDLEIDLNVNTLKDQKNSKEEGKEDDADKHTEVEDDETYEILDSLDQTDEQTDDVERDGSSEAQIRGPEGGQALHEENFQDLDSVNYEGKARPQEDSEMEMVSAFQVLDSVMEDQAASSQEEQLSEEDAVPVIKSDEDSAGKEEEKMNNIDNLHVLHAMLGAGSKQALSLGKVGKDEEVKTTKTDSATLSNDDKGLSEKVADEEEIFGSFDKMDGDQPPTGQSKEKECTNNNQQTKKSAPQLLKARRTSSCATHETLRVAGGHEETEGMQPDLPPPVESKGEGDLVPQETPIDQVEIKMDDVKQKSVTKETYDNRNKSHDLQSPPPVEKRIQLYDIAGTMLKDGEVADPNNWAKIAIVRPGRVPQHRPFGHMTNRIVTEIKSQSQMMSCFAVETSAKPGDCSDVRVTIYDHHQGPWAEIEELSEDKGPRLVAYLVAPPTTMCTSLPRGNYYNHPVTQSINKRPKRIRRCKRKKL